MVIVSFLGSLKRHIMSEHTRERPFSCPYCDWSTVMKSELLRHIADKHSNSKEYQCPYCEYCTARRYALVKHITQRHTKDKPHNCSQCDYKAVSKWMVSKSNSHFFKFVTLLNTYRNPPDFLLFL